MTVRILPKRPSYEDACDLIDNKPLEFWAPILDWIGTNHSLGNTAWSRIESGANALFDNGEHIVKIVPPNWRYQGEAEVSSLKLVNGRLSVITPTLIAHGDINGWIYILMTKLQGTCLADVWPMLGLEEKSQLMNQLGQITREIHELPLPKPTFFMQDWSSYIENLKANSVSRHRKNGLNSHLLEQVESFIEENEHLITKGEPRLIHMDLHQWNLMAEKNSNKWEVTGVIDFGDAIIGNSPLLELLTPLVFLGQGQKTVNDSLLNSYEFSIQHSKSDLQLALMVYTLIRPASNINFVMQQVLSSSSRLNWLEVARELFP